MACLIPYLKIPLIIGDFIFAVSANFSIFIVLNVHRVAVGVAIGLHFRVALWGCSRVAQGCRGCTIFRVIMLYFFLTYTFLNAKNCSKRLFKLNIKKIIRND